MALGDPLDSGRCAAPARGSPGAAGPAAAGGWPDPLAAAPARPGRCRQGRRHVVRAGGFARLVIKLADDVDSQVTAAGTIVVIRFKRPVAIPVGRLADAVPEYISSARADPDGSAIRLSLARKVTVNTMSAGERVFVDFLPDGWTGPPPGLPQEVVRELSERARAAERALRQQRADAEAKKRPPVRVRASVQPTFVRFVFEMPEGVGVSSVLNEQKLTLLFNLPLTFDLADAKVSAPPNVASINQRIDGATSMVEAELIGDVDVHSFREDKNYVVDVAFQQSEKSQAASPRASAAPQAPAPAVPVAAAACRTCRPGIRAAAGRGDTADLGGHCAAGENRDQAGDRGENRAAATAFGHAIAEGNPGCDPDGAKPAPQVTPPPVTEAPKMKPAAAAATAGSLQRRQIRRPGGTARQRRPARHLLLCGIDAGRLVPSRRCGVAGVRFRRSRSTSSRSASRAAR